MGTMGQGSRLVGQVVGRAVDQLELAKVRRSNKVCSWKQLTPKFSV